jgi:hypothetical protein
MKSPPQYRSRRQIADEQKRVAFWWQWWAEAQWHTNVSKRFHLDISQRAIRGCGDGCERDNRQQTTERLYFWRRSLFRLLWRLRDTHPPRKSIPLRRITKGHHHPIWRDPDHFQTESTRLVNSFALFTLPTTAGLRSRRLTDLENLKHHLATNCVCVCVCVCTYGHNWRVCSLRIVYMYLDASMNFFYWFEINQVRSLNIFSNSIFSVKNLKLWNYLVDVKQKSSPFN